jgi:hypothetical protein
VYHTYDIWDMYTEILFPQERKLVVSGHIWMSQFQSLAAIFENAEDIFFMLGYEYSDEMVVACY